MLEGKSHLSLSVNMHAKTRMFLIEGLIWKKTFRWIMNETEIEILILLTQPVIMKLGDPKT